jgi:hydrogenase-4 component B
MDGNTFPTLMFWLTIGWYALGVILALVLPKFRAVILAAACCAGLGSICAMISGVGVLVGGAAPVGSLETNLPFGVLTIHLDPLSAIFLVVMGLMTLPIALYAVGDFGVSLEQHLGQRVRVFALLFNLTLLSLVFIVAASDMIVFLMAWEAMAFLSYILVNFDYEEYSVTHAGYRMLAVSEIGTIGILIAFLLLYQAAGSFGFDALRTVAPMLSAGVRSAVFLLVLFGFGAKIGVLPLQLWMPDAYHAAPGFVSVLLSSVLINMGVYGLLRFLLDFLGGTGALPSWWGLCLLVIGALTALIGILYAVMQNDVKRVLAYSSVENMGIILAGIGATLTFRSYHLVALAAIALIVTIYHTLNHSVYKGLLFMGAGWIRRATGSSEFAKLGGLLRLMPWTGLCFLVAALAISAVPPLNGYISEWMLLETLLQSFALPDTLTKIVIAISGAMLALTAGIAVTAFVRTCGVSLLAMPRSKEASEAREAPLTMRVAMGFLACCCLVLGVLPTFVITLLNQVTTPLLGYNVLNQLVPPLFTNHPGSYQLLETLGGGLFRGLPVNGLVVIPAPNFSTIDSPTYLFLAELFLIVLVVVGLRTIRPLGARRTHRVWAGGIPRFTASMTYTDMAYSNPIRLIFNALYRSHARSVPTAPASRHRNGTMEYEQEVPSPFERILYQPLLRGIDTITRWARVIQSGNINQYIGYIFVIVLLILLLRVL